MQKLVVEKGRDKGMSVIVSPKSKVIVGRDRQANLQLTDGLASRRHFSLSFQDERYVLEDLGSSNGTLLNDERVTKSPISTGDQIQVGETLMSFLDASVQRKRGGLVGRRIGDERNGYQILERIGRGGMGTVYRATQLSLDREVALKILSKTLIQDKSFIERFRREARSAGQLNHPNIIQVHEVDNLGDIHYFSMEFVSGGSVQDLLRDKGKLSVEEALPVVIDVAKGLQFAEKKHIVHRDIKPDNLMLTETGRVKICDLGIAESLMERGAIEQQEGVFGSPHYIAPEQAAGDDIDHRVDLYSLGATFYRLLAGRTPFSGKSSKEIMRKHIDEEPVPLKETDPTIPDRVCKVIEKMMAKDPNQRYQNAGEVLVDLEKLTKPEKRPSPRHRRTRARAAAAKSRRVPHVVYIVAGALLALIILLLLILHFTSAARERKVRALRTRAESLVQEGRTRDAIAAYEELLGATGDGELAGRIKGEIARLRARASRPPTPSTVRRPPASGPKRDEPDEQALALFRKAADFEQQQRYAYDKAIELYALVEETYPGSVLADQAAEKRRALQLRKQRDDQAETEYLKVKVKVQGLLAVREFSGAYVACEQFRAAHAGTRWADVEVKEQQAAVVDAAEAGYREVEAAARKLVAAGKPAEAKALYEKEMTALGVPSVRTRATHKIAELAKLLGEAETAKGSAEDTRAVAELEKKLQELLASYDYGGARKRAELVLNGLSSPELKSALRRKMDAIARQRSLHDQFIARANNNKLTSPDLPPGHDGRIVRAKPSGLSIVAEKDGARAELQWKEFTPQQMCFLYRKWEHSPEDRLNLGLFCLERGLVMEAAKEAGALAQLGEELPAAIKDPAVRFRGDVRRHLEQRATALLGQGVKSFQDKRYPEAITQLERLLAQFKDTQAVAGYGGTPTITQMIAQAKAALEKKSQPGPEWDKLVERKEAWLRKIRKRYESTVEKRWSERKYETAVDIIYYLQDYGKTRELGLRALKALRSDRSHTAKAVLSRLQACAMLEGDKALAEERYRRIRSGVDDEFRLRQILGRAQTISERFPELAASREKLVAQQKTAPDDPALEWQLAELCAGPLERIADQMVALERLRSDFKDYERVKNGDVAWRTVFALERFEDYPGARTAIREFARNHSGHDRVKNGDVLWELAESYRLEGEYSKAITQYNQFRSRHAQHRYCKPEGRGNLSRLERNIQECRRGSPRR